MTYGYGEQTPPRRRGPYRDESEETSQPGPHASADYRHDPREAARRNQDGQTYQPRDQGATYPPAGPPYPPQPPAQPYASRPPYPQQGRPQSPPYPQQGRPQPPPHPQSPAHPQPPAHPRSPQDPYGQGPFPPRPTPGTYGRAPNGQRPAPYGSPGQYGQPPQTYGAGDHRPAGAPARGYPAPGARVSPEGHPPHGGPGDQPADEETPDGTSGSHRFLIIMIIIAVLAAAGGGGWLYLNHGDSSTTSVVKPPTGAELKNVADREVDPAPLSEAEVFGGGAIPSDTNGGSYKVVKTQIAKDCASAVGGDAAKVLSDAGCTQVVRATLTSPDGAYVITAGIFNLADQAKAADAQAAIRAAVDGHKGRFTGLAAGGKTDVIELAAANVAWDTRGHYLTYCVIALSNGSAIAANDPRTPLIISDIVENYLGGTVIHNREIGQESASPSDQPS